MGSFLGIIKNLFFKKPVRIVLCGTASSGKTTIMRFLKDKKYSNAFPTSGINVETV
jgi:GTPase SAR1 family protein